MIDFHQKLRELRISRGQDPDRAPEKPGLLASGTIKAWFRRHNGEIYSKDLTYEIREQVHGSGISRKGQTWTVFRLVGGSTGFESFVLEDQENLARYSPAEAIKNFEKWGYWSACAGNQVCEECRVHASEVCRAIKDYIFQHRNSQ